MTEMSRKSALITEAMLLNSGERNWKTTTFRYKYPEA